MADITDPTVTNVLNQDLRPIAEKLRAVKSGLLAARAELDALATHVTTTVLPQGHATSDVLEDGRKQVPVSFDTVISMRSLVNALAAVVDGDVPNGLAGKPGVPDPGDVEVALALLSINNQNW